MIVKIMSVVLFAIICLYLIAAFIYAIFDKKRPVEEVVVSIEKSMDAVHHTAKENNVLLKQINELLLEQRRERIEGINNAREMLQQSIQLAEMNENNEQKINKEFSQNVAQFLKNPSRTKI